MNKDITPARAIRLQPADTVAVLIQKARAGESIFVSGPGNTLSVTATRDIPCYHKIALTDCSPDQALIRNAIPIGVAIAPISAGDWVHIHNLKSTYTQQPNGTDR